MLKFGKFKIEINEQAAIKVVRFITVILFCFYLYFLFFNITVHFKTPNLCQQIKKENKWNEYRNIQELFFKVSNVVDKNNKVYCEVEFPYVTIEDEDFKNKNFIIKKGIIIKNTLLNVLYRKSNKKVLKAKSSNIYKIVKISKTYESLKDVESEIILKRLNAIINDFFLETKIKTFKLEMVFSNRNNLIGYKITTKNGVVFNYFITANKIVYTVCGKYYDHCKREISKEKFDEILNAYKNESHESYPISPSYCRTKKLDTKLKIK